MSSVRAVDYTGHGAVFVGRVPTLREVEEYKHVVEGVRDDGDPTHRPGGSLVFEVRDPAHEAWREWNREHSRRRTEITGVGTVESWVELTELRPPLVSFRWTYRFQSDGSVLTSDSTLRFRSRAEVLDSLTTVGFALQEIRDAPDRPGRELVFIALRPDAQADTPSACGF